MKTGCSRCPCLLCRRPPGFDWPVHYVLLGHGMLIAERLRNLRPLAGRQLELFLALAIAGNDAAPTRVVARSVPADLPVSAERSDR
jgi:kynurenine formamidase